MRTTLAVSSTVLLATTGCQIAPVTTDTVAQWGQDCGVDSLRVTTLLEHKIFGFDEPGAIQTEQINKSMNEAQHLRKRQIAEALPCLRRKADQSDVRIDYPFNRPVY